MTASHADDAPPTGTLTPAELVLQRRLKAIVIGLGLLIVLALAAIVARIIYQAARSGKVAAPAAIAASAPQQGPTAALLPQITVPLPRGSEIRSASLQGAHLVVQHDGPAGSGLLVVELTTGKVVSRVTFERDR